MIDVDVLQRLHQIGRDERRDVRTAVHDLTDRGRQFGGGRALQDVGRRSTRNASAPGSGSSFIVKDTSFTFLNFCFT
jgi:hypothetical protein